MTSRSRSLILAALPITVLVVALALGFGSTDEWTSEVILDLRLPRVLLAFSVGAALSLSGMILQATFSNPLCEPYTLGISSGATLGSVVAASMGWFFSWAGFSFPALAGALLFSLILDRLASRRMTSQVTLLLSGVMLGFVGSSLVSLWMAVMDSAGVQGALVWLLGDLSRARMTGALVNGGCVSVIALILWWKRRDLDALLLGETGARAIGVDFQRLRRFLILLSSVLIAFAVSASGMIGFVGLLVPHLARALGGSLHGRVIPLAYWMGGLTLILADLLARIVFRPYELPVGVVTALVGAPVFVLVLLSRARARGVVA